MRFSFPTAISLVIATLSQAASGQEPPRPTIAEPFVDSTYRIHPNFAAAPKTKDLLQQIVSHGLPPLSEEHHREAVNVIDSGVPIVLPDDSHIWEVLPSFAYQEYHQENPTAEESVVYHLEKMEYSMIQKNSGFINEVVNNTVMEMGGTIHLYISPPGRSALANHTDITDIVVLQLEGAKEWLLCQEKSTEEDQHKGLRKDKDDLSRKLSTCSAYTEPEVEQLDCERKILRAGDALYLPRRTLHSARALSDSFSAHLTFGFNDEEMCQEGYRGVPSPAPTSVFQRKLSPDCGCDSACDEEGHPCSCDNWGNSCDKRCAKSCDRSCDDCCFFQGDSCN